MKLINLPRKLVYTDRRNLDDFLRGDDGLNKELYKVYLRVKDRPYYFKFSAEKAFNEAYYIATMAMNEAHPELDVKEWWYRAKVDMGWAYAADLIMSMVYAILSLQAKKLEKIDYVLEIMKGQNYGEMHFPDFQDLVDNVSPCYSSDFTIHPLPVDELKNIPYFELNNQIVSWDAVTEDFEQERIRELVALFPSKEERLKFIDLIEQKQQASEQQKTDLGFGDSKYSSQDFDTEELPF